MPRKQEFRKDPILEGADRKESVKDALAIRNAVRSRRNLAMIALGGERIVAAVRRYDEAASYNPIAAYFTRRHSPSCNATEALDGLHAEIGELRRAALLYARHEKALKDLRERGLARRLARSPDSLTDLANRLEASTRSLSGIAYNGLDGLHLLLKPEAGAAARKEAAEALDGMRREGLDTNLVGAC
jgi:hypothetical protein